MTTAKYIKSKGIKGGLKAVSDKTKVDRRTLDLWYKTRPELFDIILNGCIAEVETVESVKQHD